MDSSGKALLPYDSRTAVAQEPPSSGQLPVVEDLASTAQRAELQRAISPGELRALLARPETQRRIRSVVKARLAEGTDPSLVDDLAQDANLMMLASRLGPRAAETAPGWIGTIARRAVANHFRRQGSAGEWMAPDEVNFGEMPARDDAPEPDVLLGDWLARAVSGDERDAETLEMLLYKARLDTTYDKVAADHGFTSVALRHRVNAFKNKYEERWRRQRAMLVLLLVFAAVAVAVAAWVWLGSASRDVQIVPAPTVPAVPTMPTAHPSATASAEDTPFEPAAPPTVTARTAPPRRAPAPPPSPSDATHRTNQFGK